MPKKKKASKTPPKKTKNIPLKAGATATHTDKKGDKFVTNVIAQGTGTGGPGSRGGKQFGGKGYKARKDKAPDSQPLGLADQLRSLEQDKLSRQRYKGGGSLSYGFPSNEGMTGSQKVSRREDTDTFAQLLKVAVRDEVVKKEQQRKQREAQEKAFNELKKRDAERSKNIPEKTITTTPTGVKVDTQKLVPFKVGFTQAGRLEGQKEFLTQKQKKLAKAFRPKKTQSERIRDEGQKFKVIERRDDQLRRIVSIPEEDPIPQNPRLRDADATARPQRAPVFDELEEEEETSSQPIIPLFADIRGGPASQQAGGLKKYEPWRSRYSQAAKPFQEQQRIKALAETQRQRDLKEFSTIPEEKVLKAPTRPPPDLFKEKEEEEETQFDTTESEEISTDESDFDTTSIKDRYRATEGGSIRDRYFDSISRARRTEPRLEQPISNAERIRRLELRRFQVQTPAEIEAQRQRDLRQFQVGGASQILTPVSNVRSRPAPRDISRGADTNREVFGVPEIPRPLSPQSRILLEQRILEEQAQKPTKAPEPEREQIPTKLDFPLGLADLSFSDAGSVKRRRPRSPERRRPRSIPSSSSDSSGPESQGGANRVPIPRRSDRVAQAEADRKARRNMLRAQAERLKQERLQEGRRQTAEYQILVGDATERDYPEFYESSGIESPAGYDPSVRESDSSYISTDEMSELGSRAVIRRDIRRTARAQKKKEREEKEKALEPEPEGTLQEQVEQIGVRVNRYRNRAPRGTAKERLPPELRDEVTELEARIKEIKKRLVELGIGRPDIAKAGTKKVQPLIFQRLNELGLIGEQSTKLLLDELFVKSARLTQLRSKKFQEKK